MNLHENKELFIAAIEMADEVLHIKKHFIEKDYWICRSLQQMVRCLSRHLSLICMPLGFSYSPPTFVNSPISPTAISRP